MQEDLEISLENRIQTILKKYLWKLEPYLTEFLFFLSIILFFIDNLILKINYSRIFDPEFQGDLGILGPIMMISMIFGMFVIFPLYPYFKFIHKELGPKSKQTYELYVSISLLITNFILNTFEVQDYHMYILFFGAASIMLIGSIFIFLDEERIKESISNSTNPNQTYITVNSLLKNKTEIILKKISQIDKNIQNQLQKSMVLSKDKKEIYDNLSKKTELIEEFVFLKKKLKKLKSFMKKTKKYLISNIK